MSGDEPASGQGDFTDLSDSGSNIDIDALFDHSDQNLSSDSYVLTGFTMLAKVWPHKPRVRITIPQIKIISIPRLWISLMRWGLDWTIWKVQ